MTDILALEQKIEGLRSEVSARFDLVHDDLKELTKALRELIRLDGDIRRLQDAIGRIGRTSDDHENRLRLVEAAATAGATQSKHLDRTQWLGVTTVVALVAALALALLLYLLKR